MGGGGDPPSPSQKDPDPPDSPMEDPPPPPVAAPTPPPSSSLPHAEQGESQPEVGKGGHIPLPELEGMCRRHGIPIPPTPPQDVPGGSGLSLKAAFAAGRRHGRRMIDLLRAAGHLREQPQKRNRKRSHPKGGSSSGSAEAASGGSSSEPVRGGCGNPKDPPSNPWILVGKPSPKKPSEARASKTTPREEPGPSAGKKRPSERRSGVTPPAKRAQLPQASTRDRTQQGKRATAPSKRKPRKDQPIPNHQARKAQARTAPQGKPPVPVKGSTAPTQRGKSGEVSGILSYADAASSAPRRTLLVSAQPGGRPLGEGDYHSLVRALGAAMLAAPSQIRIRSSSLRAGVLVVDCEGESSAEAARGLLSRVPREGTSSDQTSAYTVRGEWELPPARWFVTRFQMMGFSWEEHLRILANVNPGFNPDQVRVVSSSPVRSSEGLMRDRRSIVLDLGPANEAFLEAQRLVLFGLTERMAFREIPASRRSRLQRVINDSRFQLPSTEAQGTVEQEVEDVAEELLERVAALGVSDTQPAPPPGGSGSDSEK